jgi:hypothetical protein
MLLPLARRLVPRKTGTLVSSVTDQRAPLIISPSLRYPIRTTNADNIKHVFLFRHEVEILASWNRAVGEGLLLVVCCFQHVVTHQVKELSDLDARN